MIHSIFYILYQNLLVRSVVEEYVENHAVRQKDAAWALGKQKHRSLKSGVKGKGKWKTWTTQSLLRASLLDDWMHSFV